MLQNVLERDHGYDWLDSEPLTIAAKEHRPPYGSDGDYWSKPNPGDDLQRRLRDDARGEPAEVSEDLLVAS